MKASAVWEPSSSLLEPLQQRSRTSSVQQTVTHERCAARALGRALHQLTKLCVSFTCYKSVRVLSDRVLRTLPH